MKITGLLADKCPVGPTCPRVWDTDGDDVLVQGDLLTDKIVLDPTRRDDAARLAEAWWSGGGGDRPGPWSELPGDVQADYTDEAARWLSELADRPGALPEGVQLGAGEALVKVPRELIYGHHVMDVTELVDWLGQHHTRDLFRLEGLRQYAVDSDADDFHRYMRGEAEPRAGAGWIESLRKDTRERRMWRKVHLVADGYVTDYERYAMEWGFTRTTAAGEQVRILDATDRPDLFELGDFFVLDGEHVARNLYDDAARFLGSQVIYGGEAVALRAITDYLWRAAEPFAAWWARHPQYHRGRRAA